MIGCFMSTMYNLLHIPLCTVMLILIFNSTAYCHAHSFTFYILFFISYFSFILSYVYFPCVVFSIFALSMERTRLSFHCWLYSLCIVVYVTNKTWNLKLETNPSPPACLWLNARRPASDSMPAGPSPIAADSSSPDCRWLMPAGRRSWGKPIHHSLSITPFAGDHAAVCGESQPTIRGSL